MPRVARPTASQTLVSGGAGRLLAAEEPCLCSLWTLREIVSALSAPSLGALRVLADHAPTHGHYGIIYWPTRYVVTPSVSLIICAITSSGLLSAGMCCSIGFQSRSSTSVRSAQRSSMCVS